MIPPSPSCDWWAVRLPCRPGGGRILLLGFIVIVSIKENGKEVLGIVASDELPLFDKEKGKTVSYSLIDLMNLL